jgi:hypothetical protein
MQTLFLSSFVTCLKSEYQEIPILKHFMHSSSFNLTPPPSGSDAQKLHSSEEVEPAIINHNFHLCYNQFLASFTKMVSIYLSKILVILKINEN